MDWSVWLAAQEDLVWQGCPAPRCFTFRHWQKALFGLVVLLVALWWQWAGIGLMQERQQWWWSVVPIPVVLMGLWLSLGRVVTARLEWRQVFYALSNERLLIQCGLLRPRLIAVPREQLRYVRLTYVTEQLGHVYVEAGSRCLTLSCVEHPQALLALLEAQVLANQQPDQSA